MIKPSYYVNNRFEGEIRIEDLNITIPQGVHNLFDFNANLTYELILTSLHYGSLNKVKGGGLCYPIPDPINKLSNNSKVIIRPQAQLAVFNSRAKFQIEEEVIVSIFDNNDDLNLFGDDIKSARELAEEISQVKEDTETIQATIRSANIPEKPVEHKYIDGILEKHKEELEKIRGDIKIGYITCEGYTAAGRRCKRKQHKGKFCPQHSK